METFPIRTKRLKTAYSLIELAHSALLVSRRNVVHPDCDVYQRLEEIAFRPASTGPRIFKQVMTFEIQLSIKESCRLGENAFIGHWRMLPLDETLAGCRRIHRTLSEERGAKPVKEE